MQRTSRPVVFVVAVLLLVAVMVGRGGINAEVSQDALVRAFQLVGASHITINLNVFGKVNDSYATQEQLEQYLRQIVIFFGARDVAVEYDQHAGYREARASYRPTQDTLVEVIVQSLSAEEGALPETDVVINVTTTSSLDSLISYRRQLESCLKRLGCDSPIHCTLMGVIDGKISTSDVTRLIEQVLEELHCKTTDFYADKNVISTSAYSPFLPENPYGWDFNLQLAVRKGPEAGQYSVWLGWPALGNPY